MQFRNLPNITWDEVDEAAHTLIERMHLIGYRPGRVVAIGRGGLVVASLVAHYFHLPSIALHRCLRRHEEIQQEPYKAELDSPANLFVDDIWDSGKTIKAVRYQYPRAKMATLFFRKDTTSLEDVRAFPDFTGPGLPTQDYLYFPWDPAPKDAEPKKVGQSDEAAPSSWEEDVHV